jgi:hypothetical protein
VVAVGWRWVVSGWRRVISGGGELAEGCEWLAYYTVYCSLCTQ